LSLCVFRAPLHHGLRKSRALQTTSDLTEQARDYQFLGLNLPDHVFGTTLPANMEVRQPWNNPISGRRSVARFAVQYNDASRVRFGAINHRHLHWVAITGRWTENEENTHPVVVRRRPLMSYSAAMIQGPHRGSFGTGPSSLPEARKNSLAPVGWSSIQRRGSSAVGNVYESLSRIVGSRMTCGL
jgi:hypothetical protein